MDLVFGMQGGEHLIGFLYPQIHDIHCILWEGELPVKGFWRRGVRASWSLVLWDRLPPNFLVSIPG